MPLTRNIFLRWENHPVIVLFSVASNQGHMIIYEARWARQALTLRAEVFFSGAWLLAFVRSLAWLVSGVDGLFTRLTEEEGRNICSHGSKHSDTKEVDSWDITLYWDNNKFNGKLNIFWRQSLERFHSRGQHAVQIHWNKRKLLHKINVQPPEDWFGTPTWPPFNFFGTPIWRTSRHVKTLYSF